MHRLPPKGSSYGSPREIRDIHWRPCEYLHDSLRHSLDRVDSWLGCLSRSQRNDSHLAGGSADRTRPALHSRTSRRVTHAPTRLASLEVALSGCELGGGDELDRFESERRREQGERESTKQVARQDRRRRIALTSVYGFASQRIAEIELRDLGKLQSGFLPDVSAAR
jgi:hypothetical protein